MISVNLTPFFSQYANSLAFILEDAFPISINFVPTPSHTPFLPTEDPPDSTTGVLKFGFLPSCSAIILANGKTVEDPARLNVSLA